MKLSLRLAASAAVIAINLGETHAQSLNISAPGYTATPLFSTSPFFTLGGLAFDGSANAYYIENDSRFAANAVLYRRTSADGYVTAAPLFDLGAFSFGSFVFVSGGKVFFGDGNGAIRSINPDGTDVDLLGSIANNYDATLIGGSLYVSHNIEPSFLNPPRNRISKFELQPDGTGFALGAADSIIAADGDFSGPLRFDDAGNLYYGASGSSAVKGLYRFSAAEVLGAFGPTELTLDAAHQITADIGNSALAFGGGDDLWQDRFSGELNLIDADDGSIQLIGSSSDTPGPLDFVDGTLYVGISSFSIAEPQSAVFAVVPEPSVAWLALCGAAALRMRRRR